MKGTTAIAKVRSKCQKKNIALVFWEKVRYIINKTCPTLIGLNFVEYKDQEQKISRNGFREPDIFAEYWVSGSEIFFANCDNFLIPYYLNLSEAGLKLNWNWAKKKLT